MVASDLAAHGSTSGVGKVTTTVNRCSFGSNNPRAATAFGDGKMISEDNPITKIISVTRVESAPRNRKTPRDRLHVYGTLQVGLFEFFIAESAMTDLVAKRELLLRSDVDGPGDLPAASGLGAER
jgi:hypothetical protein